MFYEDTQSLEENRICFNCIGETYLSNEVAKSGKKAKCDYCGSTDRTLSIKELSDKIETAFETHYSRTQRDPDGLQWAMMKDPEIPYDWAREGDPSDIAIMNAADIPSQAASDVQAILSSEHYDYDELESEFSDETHYEEIMPDDHEWERGWQDFQTSIKSEARFFSTVAQAQLDRLFANINAITTKQNTSLIVEAGPETELSFLYRARVFQSEDPLKSAMMRPDLELSAPPSHYASAGRMNAKGISVFYGATGVDTALAEVRPPVGSKVALARFKIIRPLRLLNLTLLSDVHVSGSIFDPEYAMRLGHKTFLRKLAGRMSRPVMPDDQDSEYLPTQAIADYLAANTALNIDGIIFPSAQTQTEGLNVVLFHKAARCNTITLPDGTELSADTWHMDDEGGAPDYRVFEEVPPEKEDQKGVGDKAKDTLPQFLHYLDDPDDDEREAALDIDLSSVRVHHVQAITIETCKFKVDRMRWTKNDDDF